MVHVLARRAASEAADLAFAHAAPGTLQALLEAQRPENTQDSPLLIPLAFPQRWQASWLCGASCMPSSKSAITPSVK